MSNDDPQYSMLSTTVGNAEHSSAQHAGKVQPIEPHLAAACAAPGLLAPALLETAKKQKEGGGRDKKAA